MRFEKIWIEQCRATRDIRRRFGAKDALDYLVGEKLPTFAKAAKEDAAFARAVAAGDAVETVASEYALSVDQVRAALAYAAHIAAHLPPAVRQAS